ncbi:four helix bundle protein [Aquitalea sp. S1-19]|nr:four helix bundle protein [Aquitalea sp. S1-19]
MPYLHKQLDVWQQSMNLSVDIYRLTASFPVEERYGLSQQMRRASVSIPSNIAEGCGRASLRDYLHFVAIARGSLNELETQLELALRLGFRQPDPNLERSVISVGQLVNGLYRSLKRKLEPPAG